MVVGECTRCHRENLIYAKGICMSCYQSKRQLGNPKSKESQKRWRKKNPTKNSEYVKAFWKRNPQKYKAHIKKMIEYEKRKKDI